MISIKYQKELGLNSNQTCFIINLKQITICKALERVIGV
jgi:hypothetical protein